MPVVGHPSRQSIFHANFRQLLSLFQKAVPDIYGMRFKILGRRLPDFKVSITHSLLQLASRATALLRLVMIVFTPADFVPAKSIRVNSSNKGIKMDCY
jgi:hypothetical protein